VISQNRKVGR